MVVLRLAWRYATRRAVNYVAVLALALALMVQVVAVAILDGQIDQLKKRMRGLGRHITVRFDTHGGTPLPTPETFDAVARAVASATDEHGRAGVVAVTPLLSGGAMLGAGTGGGAMEYVSIHGVDLARELAASTLADHVTNFRPDPSRPSWFAETSVERDRPGLWVGHRLAQSLRLSVGDTATLWYRPPTADGEAPLRSRMFRVGGLLKSGWMPVDQYGVYAPIEEVTPLLMPEYAAGTADARRVAGFSVWLDDPESADAFMAPVQRAVWTVVPNALYVDSWVDRMRDVIEGMKHENRLVELVLFLFTCSTGFCVFAILSTLVSRRLGDMGLLRCLGATRGMVLATFVAVGGLIGVAGAGLGLGAGLAWLREVPQTADAAPDEPARVWVDVAYKRVTGQWMYPPRMYGIEGSMVLVNPWKAAGYALGAVLVSVLAGLYPACWAASREPARVLHDG